MVNKYLFLILQLAQYTTSKRNNEKWIGQFGTAGNEISTKRDVSK
jgi:hypothetical protein